jgi:hypothetical protein
MAACNLSVHVLMTAAFTTRAHAILYLVLITPEQGQVLLPLLVNSLVPFVRQAGLVTLCLALFFSLGSLVLFTWQPPSLNLAASISTLGSFVTSLDNLVPSLASLVRFISWGKCDEGL